MYYFVSMLKDTVIAICLCVASLESAYALTSDECMRIWPGPLDKCVKPACGYVTGSFASESLIDRLTPTCKAIVQRYAGPEEPVQTSRVRKVGCTFYRDASYPTNPVVVQTGVTPTFVMCTVPKAGCSQLRTLMLVMTRYPSPVSWVGEEWRVHMAPYPSMHMFEAAPNVPETAVPKFVIGRHPYTRVLSGFLDKMTWTESRGKDWDTVRKVNMQISKGMDHERDKADLFEGTREGFREFVQILSKKVLAGIPINEHFEPVFSVCQVESVQYHYFFRLEDMPTWFPCLRAGLGLGRFTDTGWDHSRKFRSDWYAERNEGCWWTPKGMTCESYAEASVDLLQGSISDIAVDAVGGHDHDIHATSADSKWREFYDQEIADLIYEMYKVDFQLFGYSRELSSLA